MVMATQLVDKWYAIERTGTDNKIFHTGRVVDDLGNGYYLLLQSGEVNMMHVVPLSRFVGDPELPVWWIFFEDEAQLKAYVEHRNGA
jgi:hypothetical protein